MALYRPLRLDAGDDPAFEYPVPVNANIDQLAAAGFYPQASAGLDVAAGIERDSSGNLILKDAVSGTWPLAKLLNNHSFVEQASNFSGSSTSFATLLSTSIVTLASASLMCLATSGFTNSTTNAATYFRILVDGVAKRGIGNRMPGAPGGSVSLLVRVIGLSAGSHTVALQYRVGSGTLQIRPVTQPDSEHCSLLTQVI